MKRLLALFLVGCGSHATPAAPIAMTIPPVSSSSVQPLVAPPVVNEATTPGSDLVVGSSRICLRSDGKVYCVSGADILDKVLIQDANRIAGFDETTSIAVGGSFLCASRRDGSVICTGENTYGELGGKRSEERIDSAVQVVDVAHARRVVAGPSHACAILEDQSVRCWGRNERGQTGGDTYYMPEARDLAGSSLVPGVRAIGLVANYGSTCALRTSRDVICWGAKQDQRYGWGPNGPVNEPPTVVSTVTEMDEVAGSESEFCGLQHGAIVCWTPTSFVDPSTRNANSQGPWPIPGVANAKHFAITSDHGCAVLGNGRVSCFGYGYSGALGYQADGYDPLPAKLVEGINRATAIAVTAGQSCALTADNELYCWGRWYTGKGTRDELTPVRVHLH